MENRVMMNDRTYFGVAHERTNWLNVGALVSFISALIFMVGAMGTASSAAGTAINYAGALISAIAFEIFARKEINALCRETEIKR